jgi:cytochrome oxidase Cu insertion factor (SCO1/SenC/PrrC family)
MRFILLFVICLISVEKGYNQYSKQKGWINLIKFSDNHVKDIIVNEGGTSMSVDSTMQKAINEANGTFSLSELTHIVNICSAYCNTSAGIALSLTKWLREDHPIYDKRSPIDANQFRAFLLASLGHFSPNEEIYKYVKSELIFADHGISIAAAAATARNFRNKAAELVPLMEPFLTSSFPDEWVDISTPELNYPIINPTKARYEIIQTLVTFGASAYHSVKLLDQIAACNGCGEYGRDSALYKQASQAAEHIRKVTPECCRNDDVADVSSIAVQSGLTPITKQDRKPVFINSIKLLDQEGDSLRFKDLIGQPFILTFFYTQCTNASKCVSTVDRLGKLEAECMKDNLSEKIGIYAMTYDPDYDSPSIIKKYGELYGVKFNSSTKFLKTVNSSDTKVTDQLHLRVNYGAGTINQHGIQLFVFDKEGKIAAVCDNDSWSVNDVKNCLSSLINEQ